MMPKKLIIHCGTYKTGSSSLQNYLSNDLSNSFKYAESGLFTKEPEVGIRHSLLVYSSDWQLYCDELIKEILDTDVPIVISSEAYSRSGSVDKLSYLVGSCKDKGIIVKGLIYIRNYFDYIRSFYREMTQRRGNMRTPEDFFGIYHRGVFDYKLMASNFSKVFGTDCIDFVAYKKGIDVISIFYDLCGFDYLDSAQEPIVKSNQSITALETEVIRVLNSRDLSKNSNEILFHAKDFLTKNTQAVKGLEKSVESLSFVEEPSSLYKEKLNKILCWKQADLDELYIRPNIDEGKYLDTELVMSLMSYNEKIHH
ncbi:hypothetical protein [Psychrobacter immobilis]|uniref:hypothetical protein n=1 Tax=Psychrobacter immobilis TaxID=498 RepID=UPI00191A15E6|nr:hypothetical protein [Psychrobacter immobilis]